MGGQERRLLPSSAKTSTTPLHQNLAVVLRDDSDWLSHIRALQETDVLILLTPMVVPISEDIKDSSDPFEKLGRSLAQRHQRIRQIPYTKRYYQKAKCESPKLTATRNGITSTHIGFIKRRHVVILCFAVQPDEQINLEVGAIAFAVNDNKPCIIVVCCSPIDPKQNIPFPTVIQTAGYSPSALEATAKLIFGENAHLSGSQSLQTVPPQAGFSIDTQIPKAWNVEEWNSARDAKGVHNLWLQCINPKFIIDQGTLVRLLNRPGYAKHYVVRDPEGGHLLGFCATYLSYVDREGEKLIASLAVLLIPPAYRSKGIGLSLHKHGMTQLQRTRGVTRLQLGSTYPRLFYGPPCDIYINKQWFGRRGWQLNSSLVHDLILFCGDWPASVNLPPIENVTFQQCVHEKMDEVLALVEKAAVRQSKTGWFDQYWSLMDSPNIKDILIGVEKGTIIAAALTYTPGNQISSNLPWAGLIGSDVGGVTCICLYRKQKHFLEAERLREFQTFFGFGSLESIQVTSLKIVYLCGVLKAR